MRLTPSWQRFANLTSLIGGKPHPKRHLLAALGIALNGAFGLAGGLGGVRGEALGLGGFAKLANLRMLVFAYRRLQVANLATCFGAVAVVCRLRVQFEIDRLAPLLGIASADPLLDHEKAGLFGL